MSIGHSLPARAYYWSRRWFTWSMDRLVERCDEAAMEACALPPGAGRQRAQSVAQSIGSMAYLLKGMPRVDVIELRGPQWRCMYLGDPAYFGELVRLLFPSPPELIRHARIPLWAVPRVARARCSDTDLVVVGLGRAFQQFLRPRARYVAHCPVWVEQVLDITPSLEQQLSGRSRRNARKSAARAVRAGFTARTTTSYAEFEHFHRALYRPHVLRRHGQLAEVTTVADQWSDWMTGRGELLLLELDGEVVAGIPLRYIGRVCFNGDEGVSQQHGDELYHMGVQAALWRFAIERAKALGMQEFAAGLSLARCADPVFRSKRRWGAVTRPSLYSGFPEWTFMADHMPDRLRSHLNAQGLLTFVDGAPAVVQLGDEAPDLSPEWKHIGRVLLVGSTATGSRQHLITLPV